MYVSKCSSFLFSEYVRNLNNICKYNCDKKMDLIREGLGKKKSMI